MTMPQLVEAIKPTTYKAPIPRKKYFTKDGVRYIQDQIFSDSLGKFSDVGEPRTEFKPTEYKPSNPTPTQKDFIEQRLIDEFPGINPQNLTKAISYVWGVVDKDVYDNKTSVTASVDKVIKDFEDKGVVTTEEKFGGLFSDTKLNPERIYGENKMQPLEEKDGWSINREINEDKIKDTSFMSGFR
jgi:hypothetical protein